MRTTRSCNDFVLVLLLFFLCFICMVQRSRMGETNIKQKVLSKSLVLQWPLHHGNESKRQKPTKEAVVPGLELQTNFADMLHLLTISLARPLLLWRSWRYCRHSYQGSQPASINRLQREILRAAGRQCESNYIRRTCHRLHKGAMHCDSVAQKKENAKT